MTPAVGFSCLGNKRSTRREHRPSGLAGNATLARPSNRCQCLESSKGKARILSLDARRNSSRKGSERPPRACGTAVLAVPLSHTPLFWATTAPKERHKEGVRSRELGDIQGPHCRYGRGRQEEREPCVASPLRPEAKSPTGVVPERETPGIKAKIWEVPTAAACDGTTHLGRGRTQERSRGWRHYCWGRE